ncbi:hypothetical protein XPA_004717 [Xanthoria parietina]
MGYLQTFDVLCGGYLPGLSQSLPTVDYNEDGLLTRYEEAVFVTFLPSPGKDMFAGLLVPCDHFSRFAHGSSRTIPYGTFGMSGV